MQQNPKLPICSRTPKAKSDVAAGIWKGTEEDRSKIPYKTKNAIVLTPYSIYQAGVEQWPP